MKQIDNKTKKTYVKPAFKVVNIDQADIICTSDPIQPYGYDDELD